MKKTTMKLSLAAFAVLGSTTLFAGAVADGPQLVHSGETMHLDGSQSFARGRITEPKWYIENLTHPVREVTPIVSQELSANITAPEVNETTEFRYTLSVVSLLRTRTIEYSKNSIVVTVEPTSAEANGTVNNEGSATISYDGFTYIPVRSPITGRIWLDRSIGASAPCTTGIVEECTGDHYQWGREADGHQIVSARVIVRNQSASTLFGNGNIFFDNFDGDWFSGRSLGVRSNFWSQTDGNSVCPIDYRVATIEELSAEFVNGQTTNSILGFLNNRISRSSLYWSSSHDSFNGIPFRVDGHVNADDRDNINDYSIRCIKD